MNSVIKTFKKDNTEFNFNTYYYNDEVMFDVRDLRDYFGYTENKHITRAISDSHVVATSKSVAISIGITDSNNK